MEQEKRIEMKLSMRHMHTALLIACIFLLAVTNVLGLDIWWHLAVGRYLLSSFAFPRWDVFSFTGSGWDNKEWLFGILVYCIERMGGVNLLTLAKAALFAATFYVLYVVSVRRSGRRYIPMAVVLLGALACRVRLAFRPELCTYFFIALLLLFLEEYMAGRRKPLLFFPLIMILWVNLHPLAIIGLVILLIHIINGIVCRIFRAQAERHSWRVLGGRELALLVAVLVASCVAFTCNPISAKRFLSPLELMTTHAAYLSTITEAKPLPIFQFPAFAGYVLLAVFTLVMFVTIMQPADSMMIVLFGIASVTMARNAPLLPVCTAPIIACQLARFLAALPEGGGAFVVRWRRPIDAAIAVILAAFAVRAVLLPDFGLGYAGIIYPVGAVQYIEAASPLPKMFNIYDWGGFLIWKLFPRYKVFMDGRGPDTYGPDVWAEYQTVELGRDGWEEILDRYGVNFALVSTANKLHNLIERLDGSPRWRLGYWDLQSMIFLRDIEGNRPLIEAYQYRGISAEPFEVRGWGPEFELQLLSEVRDYLKAHPDSLEARNLLAAHHLRRGEIDRAVAEFESAAAAHPEVKRVHYNLGLLYSQKGDTERAMAEYEKEIAADGGFPPAYNNLGRIFYERRDLAKAARCFKKALKIDPRYVHAMNNLGLVYMEEGNYKEAVGEFSKALEIEPGYQPAIRNLTLAREMIERPAETCNRLGQIFYGQGDLDRAEAQFKKAVEHNPRYTIAIGNLGVVYMRKGRRDEAIRMFEEVVAIDPSDAAARQHLAILKTEPAGAPPQPQEGR